MPLKPCLDCGTPTTGTRCRAHHKTRHQLRPDLHTPDWKRRRTQILNAWREQHGNFCPGYQTGPHPSTDLTVDHITPVSQAGPHASQLAVLCRACNGRKGQAERR